MQPTMSMTIRWPWSLFVFSNCKTYQRVNRHLRRILLRVSISWGDLDTLRQRLAINEQVNGLSPGPELDTCLLCQLKESIASHGSELSEATRDVLALDDDEGELIESCSRLKAALFDTSLKTKWLMPHHASRPKTMAPTSVKLRNISIPTFDGNILNWSTFWDQFNVAVHSSTQLSDSQKLVYLREPVKDGPAKSVIKGLSQSSENYSEAINCLTQRYDRPHRVHQA